MKRSKHSILEGTDYETPVYVIEADEDGPTAVVVGGVHGNEVTAPEAADLIKLWSISRGKLVVIPRANVPALEDGTRHGPSGDMNRHFPAGEQPLSEKARALWDEITRHNPDFVFDLHRSRGLYKRNPSGVGQAIFPTPNARTEANAALSHLNDAHVERSTHNFRVGNDQDGRNPLLSHKVGADLPAKGWLVETTHYRQSAKLQREQLEHAVQTLLWHATGGEMVVEDFGHENQIPKDGILEEFEDGDRDQDEDNDNNEDGSMADTARIEITAIDGEKRIPIPGATIRGVGDDRDDDLAIEFKGETGPDGTYTNTIFTNTYTIETSAPGFETTSFRAEIDQDWEVRVEVVPEFWRPSKRTKAHAQQLIEEIERMFRLNGGGVGIPNREPDAVLAFDDEDEYKGRLRNSGHNPSNHSIETAPDGDPALEIRYPKANPDAVRMNWRMADELGKDPKRAYIQYDLCLPEDYEFLVDAWNHGGSKLPGPAGNYGGRAMGGSRPEGRSWSIRPHTVRPAAGPHRRDLEIPGDYGLGSQIYHMDHVGKYGDHPLFDSSLEFGRFHSIGIFVEMNDVDEANGVAISYVDGKPVHERYDIRYRNDEDVGMREIWMGFYFGGGWGAQRENEKTWIRNFKIWDLDDE